MNATLQSPLVQGAFSTLIFLVLVAAARFALLRYVVQRRTLPPHQQRWWTVTIRNVLGLVFVIGLVFIWAEELRSFAVSLVAVAVAFAIVTKELLLCLIGTTLRTLTRSHSIGDHIEIGDARAAYSGYVVDQTMLSTTIDQTESDTREYSGRQVVLPNSLLVTSPLTTDFVVGGYTMQLLRVPLSAREDVAGAERALLDIANEECAPVVEKARRHGKRRALTATTLEPHVSIDLPSPDIVHLLLRIPVSAQEGGRQGQTILRRFLSERGRVPPVDTPASG